MNFLQTSFLLGGLAVAIPILVHLLSRRQVREIELGTMRFLQEIIQDGSQRRKIRRWLLLLTRMAAIALLVLLFARPYLRKAVRRDGNRVRVILIDRSASMAMPNQGGRLIDDAVNAAVDAADELGSDAIIQWAWFDRQVEPFEAPGRRVSAPRGLVGDTDYASALMWARDRIATMPDAIADVVLITDLQRTGLASDLGQRIGDGERRGVRFPKDVPVRLVDVGRPAANNLALQSVTSLDKRLPPDRNANVMVTLFNYGSLPMEEIPITATAVSTGPPSRTVRLKKSINVPNGQAQEVQFDFGRLEPATWQVTVAMDVDDDLAMDNRRITAFQIGKPAGVIVLDGGTDRSEDELVDESSASYYLQAALRQTKRRQGIDEIAVSVVSKLDEEAPANGRFDPRVVFLGDGVTPALDVNETPLIVVSQSGSLAGGTLNRIADYVRDGGRLLVFAGAPAKSESVPSQAAWQDAGLSPGEIGRLRRSGAMPFRIATINDRDPMMQPFEDPQQGDLGRLSFDRFLSVKPGQDTDVLAAFESGSPAITRHRLGAGTIVWFLSSADDSWSTWPTNPLYLPLVQQMAADLLNLTGEGPIRFRDVGDDRMEIALVEPASKGDLAITPTSLQQAAAIAFTRPGFEFSNEAMFVINSAAKESDPSRLNNEEFAERFQINLADTQADDATDSVVAEQKHELWPWMAAAGLLCLVAEFSLANRTTA